MAFIREYAAQDQGDPFSLRIPKRLRKLKVGRFLGNVAKSAVSFVPGVGGIASSLLNRIAPIAARFNMTPDDLVGFARSYGYDIGDPAHAPKPAQKRKSAGAGPKAKAAKKANKRQERAARGASPSKKGGGNVLTDPAKRVALEQELAGLLPFGKGAMALTGLDKVPGAAHHGFGGHRRRMNPTNVKALNRSLRRVEGFEKLVHRVMGHKLFKKVRGPAPSHRGHGHRAGCRCVVCKRAA